MTDLWGVHHWDYGISLGWFFCKKTGKVWAGTKEQALQIKESFPGTGIWRLNNTGAGCIRPGVLMVRLTENRRQDIKDILG